MLLHTFTYKSSSIYFSSVLSLIIYVNRFKSHVCYKRKTWVCTMWPKFPFACRLLIITSTKKIVSSRLFLSFRIVLCWLFLSAYLLFWEILNLNLTFAYRGFQGLFFSYLELDSSRQSRDSEAQSGAFSNREHGLFHLSILTTNLWSKGNDCRKSDSKYLYFWLI